MKRLFKWTGILVGSVLLIAVALAVQVIYFRPFSINVFFNKALMQFALDNPEMLSSMGVLESVGLNFHNDDLADASMAKDREDQALMVETLETLRSYDYQGLDEGQKLSYDILEFFLQQQVDGIPFNYHNYPVNQMFGIQNGMPTFMTNIHRINSVGDAENYITRLTKIPTKFSQAMEGLKYREEQRIIPPRFTVTKVIEEMQGFVDTPPAENILVTSMQEKLDKMDLAEDQRQQLLDQAEIAVAESVYPAYREYISYFTGLLAKATENNGVWALPDGDALYSHLIYQHTTTRMTPQEVHQIGVQEVARIELAMDAILSEAGMTEGTIGERVTAMSMRPEFLYADSDEARDQILEDFTAIIEEINRDMDRYFGVLPRSPLEVKRIPEFREKTSPGAYYQPPSMDGSRPGVFYVNLRDTSEVVKFGMRTLAYHEGVPGHHFQSAIAAELEGVPMFRNILGFTAYSEGWGLYAEQLAKEIGFQEDPFDDLGRLQGEMMRAVRLVVDSGIHHKRWTREQAMAYMQEKTGMPEAEVVTEIERYFVMPGQALAYKVGMMKILELREKTRKALGDRFDLKEFHDVVLARGELPLELLERQVDRYIEARS